MHRRVEERRVRREERQNQQESAIQSEERQSKEGSAVMDSGARSTVIRPEDDEHVIDTYIPSNKIFIMANGAQAKAGNQARLKRNLRGVAATADKVPELQNNSLVATSKLADENYHTVFTPTAVMVYDGENDPSYQVPIWKGWRCRETGLWRVPLVETVNNVNTDTRLLQPEEMLQAFNQQTLSVYNLQSKSEVVKYLHAALGFPTKETLLATTRAGFLTSWPGLNVSAINKYFPESVETQKGHMKHQRQGVRSTKIPQLQADVTDDERAQLEKEMKALKQKHRDIFIRVYEEKEIVYSDQTGKFPTTSSRGNKYLMVCYYIDGSYIMMEPMKSRNDDRMTQSKRFLPKEANAR
jgi:hypothetical protein